MTDTGIAREVTHIARTKDGIDKPKPLVQVKLQPLDRRNTGGILSAMLQ